MNQLVSVAGGIFFFLVVKDLCTTFLCNIDMFQYFFFLDLSHANQVHLVMKPTALVRGDSLETLKYKSIINETLDSC